MPNPDLDNVQLAELLRRAREYFEPSEEEVGRMPGMPRRAISIVESAQRPLDALDLKRLAELYQRPVGYFAADHDVTAALPPEVEDLAQRSNLSEKDRA